MKKVIVFAAVVIGAVGGRAVVKNLFKPDMTSEAFLSKVAAEANEGMPMRLDSETTCLRTSAAPGRFTYEYQLVNVTADQVDVGRMREALVPQLTAGACGGEVRKLLEAGVTLRYSYADRDDRKVLDVDVVGSDCT